MTAPENREQEIEERRRRIDRLTRELGSDHPHVMAARFVLILELRANQNLTEAESECREVLTLQDRTLGSDHEEARRTRTTLAAVLRELQRFDESVIQYRSLLDITGETEGSERVLATRYNLALTLLEAGKEEEARREALSVGRALDRKIVEASESPSRRNLSVLKEGVRRILRHS